MTTTLSRQDKILGAAQALFLKYGVRSISMDDIAQRLGISKKTLYQYVKNKRELIAHTVAEHIRREEQEIHAICERSTDAIDEMLGIAKYVMRLLRHMQPTLMYDLQKYYPESWQLLESLHSQYVEECIRQNIEKGIRQGLYRADINPTVVSRLYVGKSLLLADESLFPLRQFDRQDLFREYIFYHIHGIASETGLQRLQSLTKADLL